MPLLMPLLSYIIRFEFTSPSELMASSPTCTLVHVLIRTHFCDERWRFAAPHNQPEPSWPLFPRGKWVEKTMKRQREHFGGVYLLKCWIFLKIVNHFKIWCRNQKYFNPFCSKIHRGATGDNQEKYVMKLIFKSQIHAARRTSWHESSWYHHLFISSYLAPQIPSIN